jgi:hypothetical protein
MQQEAQIQYYFHSSNAGGKREYSETVHQLFIDFTESYDSVRTEVLYNILIDFGGLMKLVRLTKMCLNEIYTKVRTCLMGIRLIHFLFRIV